MTDERRAARKGGPFLSAGDQVARRGVVKGPFAFYNVLLQGDNMKHFLLLFLGAIAIADDGDFAKHKSEMLKHIDERIQKMTEHKNCVSGAADKDGLKKCRESMREWRKGEMQEMRERRMDGMQKRLDKLKEKSEEKKPE